MKTQAIQLESYDDVISVRDKMSWAKTDRILLVIPRRAHILARTLDLRLLKRHATLVGAQLAIVTRDAHLHLVAKELGIPVFSRLSSAKRKDWPEARPPQKIYRPSERPNLRQMRRDISLPEASWRDRPVYRFLFFTLAVLATLVVVLTFVPSAIIQLAPSTGFQSLAFTANASSDFSTINLAGNLPVHSTSVIVERTRSAPTTGSIATPNSRATGSAHFRNLTTGAVNIPAGTVISTQTQPTIRFATTTGAQLAAGVGKTVDVSVQAVEAGSNGNLPIDALVAMEGDLGASLAVTNSQPTTGGSDKLVAVQTESDRAALHAALLADILGECKTDLKQTLLPGDVYFPDSLAVSEIIDETYFPAEDQTGETLSLTLRLQCQAQYVMGKDVNTLTGMLLNVNLPDDYVPVSGGLTVVPASVPVTDIEGITHWDVQALRSLQVRMDPLMVEQISMGHRPVVAVQLLKRSLQLVGTPVIQLKPSWWPWVPLIPFRITVSTGQ